MGLAGLPGTFVASARASPGNDKERDSDRRPVSAAGSHSQGILLPGLIDGLGENGVPAISDDGHYGVFERFDQASNAIQTSLIQTGF